MASRQDPDLYRVEAALRSMRNAELKAILKNEHLVVSGVKAVLQARIIDHFKLLRDSGPIDRYNRFRAMLLGPAAPPAPSTPSYSPPASSYQPSHTARSPHPSLPSRPPATMGHTSQPSFANSPLNFKDSPFYTIVEPLTPVVECKVREHTRDSVDIKVTLSTTVAALLHTEPNLQIMLYCAMDNGLTRYGPCDIAFPQQVELKVNLDEVKANLRGLKNRPGSTRPADITKFIRKKAGYTNHVVMTYALTQKKYFVVVNLVRRHSVDDLVKRLQIRKTISADQVIREMRSRAGDADIVATASVMSLKCPLSTLRISVPCRSSICTHNQCFDAASFLQLQEQAPTWTCPVCNKSVSFEALQVDKYVENILQSTPSSLDQVTVEPNGEWSQPDEENTLGTGQNMTPNGDDDDDDDDDLVEVTHPRLKQEPGSAPLTLMSTPSAQSREPSSVSSVPRPSSNKRPASQVIDLTLSDDDDDEPPRPAKRPTYTGGIPSRFSGRNLFDGSSDLPLGNSHQTNNTNNNASNNTSNHYTFSLPGQNGGTSPSQSSFYYNA
ncbi:hypothetical protein AJ80_06439 [Polytolypa hystricis UAMH7299]|uniref:SP-RING-type domain-containing protein n=1 Tax=Polytolypa hystricis (strain UAMH7299) TaxID=1447883 RepID=A0A2B7XWM8_POLH7|nr:hypothetical protein AJ80_06439 [Polytolypa hystricis UAMH7299]